MSQHMSYEEIVTGVDVDQTSTAVFQSDGFFGIKELALDVSVASGAWGSTVLIVQCSANGTRWTNLRKMDLTALTITTDSMVMDIEPFKMKHLRVIPTVASGETCTVDIVVQGIAT